MIKQILIVGLLLVLVVPCMAIDINIYYPTNNTTTEIQYAESGNYTLITANNVSGNFSAIIINDELEYESIIESPHKIISPLFKLVIVVILFTLLILVVILIRNIWRRL